MSSIAGVGAALVNSGLVMILSICLIKLSKDPFNGFTMVEMGLMAGFSLFGKNFLNIWPIILGTWLYAKYQREPFSKHASVALLATSLAPLVSYMALGSIHASIPLGIAVGVMVGFILPLACRLRDKWIFVLACVLLVQPLPLYYIARTILDPEFAAPVLPTGSLWAATFEVQGHGTFLETLRVNLWEGQLASLAWAWDHGRVFQTAALFLFGYLIGRRGLFLKENLKFWNKVLCGSLVAFFPLYGLGNMLPDFVSNPAVRTPLLLVVSSLYKFAFMLLLVSAVLNAYYRTNLQQRMNTFIPYGRMSLTNYITQSIIGSMLFYNWGFSLHDDWVLRQVYWSVR